MGGGDRISDDPPVGTLHLTDARTTIHARQCASIASATASVHRDVIVVALAASPARWFEQWADAVGDATDHGTFVIPDDVAWRASDACARLEAAAPEVDVSVATVASPGNLTDIGVTLTEQLKSLGARDDDAGPEVELCFQSLTSLLQYASLDDVYRFLHALLANLDAYSAVGHFHLHAGAHDERTVASLRPLFHRVEEDADTD